MATLQSTQRFLPQTEIVRGRTIVPALITIENGARTITPLLVSRVLLYFLFAHQWAMVNYYAVMEIGMIVLAIATGITTEVFAAPKVQLAAILIKSMWWGIK